MDVSGGSEDFEEKSGRAGTWSGGQVKSGEENEGDDILEVVQVSSTDSFDIGIAEDNFATGNTGCILGICEGLHNLSDCLLK